MTLPNLLFVDDDVHLLHGLKRMLRSKRNLWNMEFVESGADALIIGEQHPLDVLVTDIRMPEMNGASLLEEFAQRWPTTVRLVLSGQADRESTFRTVCSSHQFMAKPCDSEILAGKLTAILEARAQISPEDCNAVTAIRCLPSPPDIIRDLRAALKNANTSHEQIAKIVHQDIALTVKLLQLVNSAYFGRGSNIHALDSAARLLGIETLNELMSVQGFVKLLDTDAGWAGDYVTCLNRGKRAGELGEQAAAELGLPAEDQALIRCACHLSFLGEAAMLTTGRDDFPARQPISVYLATIWGLPSTAIDLINDRGDTKHAQIVKAVCQEMKNKDTEAASENVA